MLKPKKSRSTWGIFLLARAFDCIYLSNLNKFGKKWKYDYLIYFNFFNVLTGYCYAVEPTLISPGLYTFYKYFANEAVGD